MSSAVIRIGADTSDFRRGLSSALGEMGSFAKQVAAVTSGQALFAGLQGAVSAVGAVLRGFGETFKESVSVAGEFEAVVAQFTTFYKSADLAQGAVAELAKYAATTSFQLGEISSAGAGLAAAGVPAEQLKESIRIIGDIAAGTKKPLAEILQPYVKTLSVGKMQTETFLQFLERGIPIGEELKKALNLDDAGLQKALTGGKISAQDMVNALQAMTTTGLFSGAAAAQGQTLNGLLSTLADNVEEVKRNLGLAASSGLKPLIEFAQTLVGKFAPLGTALGNIFTAATAKALQFGDDFAAGFGKAVDFAVNAFQVIEGAIKNGTLWDVLVTSGKIAFLEVTEAAVRALQGIAGIFDEGNAFTGLGGLLSATLVDALGTVAGAVAGTIGSALLDAAKAWLNYVLDGIKRIPAALGELMGAIFSSGNTSGLGQRTLQGMGAGQQRFQTAQSFMPQASGMTAAQAQEIVAAKAAGYPTPLTPGEVRETFAGGRRITYNTKETLSNGAIIPPSNSDAYAEGTPGQGLIAAFERGFGKQTTATERLQAQNEKLRVELAKLTEAALRNATAIREQSSTLKSTSELTAKQGQTAAEEKAKSGITRTGDQFTSLQKIGGGIRRMNLAAGPLIPMEGKAPGLKAAGDLGGGFANSPRFVQAQEAFKRDQAKQQREAMLQRLPILGPPAPPPVATPEQAATSFQESQGMIQEVLLRISRGQDEFIRGQQRQGSFNLQAT
jgi:tape measure domain-containing protein